ETLIESVLSPRGRWAALATEKDTKSGDWRLRVVSLATGKVALDEPGTSGTNIRAISDLGLLVASRQDEAVIVDVPAKTRRTVAVEVGHRAFFRSATELVYIKGATVGFVDLSAE